MDLTNFKLGGLNTIDLLLIALLLLGIWRGWRVGFVVGVIELAGLAAGLLAAFFVSPWLAATLERHALLREPWASPAAFFVVFVLAQIVLSAMARRLLRPLSANAAGPAAQSVNRTLGLFPGAANGTIHAMVVAVLLTALPIADSITRAAQDSPLAARLGVPADWLEHRLAPSSARPWSVPCRRSR